MSIGKEAKHTVLLCQLVKSFALAPAPTPWTRPFSPHRNANGTAPLKTLITALTSPASSNPAHSAFPGDTLSATTPVTNLDIPYIIGNADAMSPTWLILRPSASAATGDTYVHVARNATYSA